MRLLQRHVTINTIIVDDIAMCFRQPAQLVFAFGMTSHTPLGK
jgi:hypothetical protein